MQNLQQKFCLAFTVDFTVYNFAISCQDRKWFIQKRFSQFDQLDTCVSISPLENTYHTLTRMCVQQLNLKYADLMVNIQRLPPKQMFGSLSASLIALRQKSLDAYLQSILIRPELTMTEEVRDFVGECAALCMSCSEGQR